MSKFIAAGNSRELALLAAQHQATTRLPWTLYVSAPLAAQLSRQWGPRPQWPCPPDDIIRILWDVETTVIDTMTFADRFGCRWKREQGGYTFIDPPLAEPDAEKIPQIELVTAQDVLNIQAVRRQNPDRFIFYQFTSTLGERMWNLRGMGQALEDFLLEPQFVHAALDRLVQMHHVALDRLLDLPIDGVTIGDDFGTQRGPMISLDIFRTFFKPRMRDLYARIRRAGKLVGLHSCGDVTIFLPDLVDIGLQVLHPLQSEAMDIRQVKRQFGRHLTFRGGIGTQRALVHGTPEQAVAEVRESVDVLARGGGYWLETVKPLPEEMPLANAQAVIQAMGRLAQGA